MVKKKSWIWSLMVIVLIAVTSYAFFLLTDRTPLPEGFVYGNGHIEGRDVKVAAEREGRVLQHSLVEGESVTAGDVLVEIDPSDAEDLIRATEAELTSLKENIAAIDNQLSTWRHHVETAERQLQRVRSLQAKKLASQHDIDTAENAVKEAQGQLQVLRNQRKSLNAQVEAANARVSLAESQRDKLEVTAPLSGTVLIRAVETGEIVSAGQPLAVIVDLGRLELKVYVSTHNLNRINLGDDARIRVDGLERYFTAKVSRIDDFAQFTPRDIHMPDERQRMVYGVTLILDNTDNELKPGMPADAWIRWDTTAEWPELLMVPGS
ncbi:efflux RND transporter periplasmic adaptor subunit [Methylophaga sp.]|jgi:HlyD family secretion protein|uniref:HlyD family secretion protein n=1 Tax=Methylophaga sp. TaxID=2024840 RepID=UPI0013FF91EB|nr:efflux RND transporter periplasmic adaptor subunit [Methylophaga sp.]MTI64848.1 efflux RND transporter periplasmic adaptor subunit [Methylophaga sp.]